MELGESLENNHSIFGIHFEGNQMGCVIDTRGFLRILD